MTDRKTYDHAYIKERPHEIVEHYLGTGRTEGVRVLWDCPSCGGHGKFAVNTSLGMGGCWKDGCPAALSGDSFDLVGYFEGFEAPAEFPRAIKQAAWILGMADETTNGTTNNKSGPAEGSRTSRNSSTKRSRDSGNGTAKDSRDSGRAEPSELQQRLALADSVFRRVMELCPLEKRDVQFWQSRGVTPRTIQAAGFGSITSERAHHIKKLLEDEFGREALLIVPGFSVKNGKLIFTLTGNYTLIAYHDTYGRITTIEGRAIGQPAPNMGKYVSLRGAGNHLYVFPGIDPSELVAVTEGPIGAIVAAQYGLKVGAIQGCERYRASSDPGAPDGEPGGALLEIAGVDFEGRTIFYIPDSDDPPNEQVLNTAPKAAFHLAVPQNGAPAVCWLPAGQDLDQWLLSLETGEHERRFEELLGTAREVAHGGKSISANEVTDNRHRNGHTASAPTVNDNHEGPDSRPPKPQEHSSGQTTGPGNPAGEHVPGEYDDEEPAAGSPDEGRLFDSSTSGKASLDAQRATTDPVQSPVTPPQPPDHQDIETSTDTEQDGNADPRHGASRSFRTPQDESYHQDRLYEDYTGDQGRDNEHYEAEHEDTGNYETIEYADAREPEAENDDETDYTEEDYVDGRPRRYHDLQKEEENSGEEDGEEDDEEGQQHHQNAAPEPPQTAGDPRSRQLQPSNSTDPGSREDGATGAPDTPENPETRKPTAAERFRHEVYRELLKACPPKEEHLQALHEQGVDPDFAALAGLGSIDEDRARSVAADLEERFGAKRLSGVPGFEASGTGRMELSLRGEYLLAPCLDAGRRITALEALAVDLDGSGVNAEEGVPLTGAGSHLYLHPDFTPREIEGFCEGTLGALLAAQEGVAVASIQGFRRYKARSGPSIGKQKPDAVLPELRGVDFLGERRSYVPRIVPGEENSRYQELETAAHWLIKEQNGTPVIAGVPDHDEHDDGSDDTTANDATGQPPQARYAEPLSLGLALRKMPREERKPLLRQAFPLSRHRQQEEPGTGNKPEKPGAPITKEGVGTRIGGAFAAGLMAAAVTLVLYWILGLLEAFSLYVRSTSDGMAVMDGGTLGRMRELSGAWPLQLMYSSRLATALIAGALSTIPVLKRYHDRARLKEQAAVDKKKGPWTLHRREVRHPLAVLAQRREELRGACAEPLLGGPFKESLRFCWPSAAEAGSRWGWMLLFARRSTQLAGRALWQLCRRLYLLARTWRPLTASDVAVVGLWWVLLLAGLWVLLLLAGPTVAPLVETAASAGEGTEVQRYMDPAARVVGGVLEEPLVGALWLAAAGAVLACIHRMGIRSEEVRLLSGKIND